MSNYERLSKAGLIDAQPSPENLAQLEALSAPEVDHLLSIKGMLGGAWLRKGSVAASFLYF